MRFHERSLNIKWKKGVKRPEKSNAIDMLCSGQVPPRSQFEVEDYERNFEEVPQPFTPEERESWLSKLEGVVVSSDAFVSCALEVLMINTDLPHSSHSSTTSTAPRDQASSTLQPRPAARTMVQSSILATS